MLVLWIIASPVCQAFSHTSNSVTFLQKTNSLPYILNFPTLSLTSISFSFKANAIFFWHQTNVLLCNFTSRSIPLALMLTTKSSATAKLSFAATKSCPVLMMMLASSLTILGMHLQSKAQHCSSYTLFSNVGTVLVVAVCCNIGSSLCHSWWMLTLKQEGGQSTFCRFLLLQHIRFLTKVRLSLDSVIPPLGKFRVPSQGLVRKVLCFCSLSGQPHWDLSPPTTIQSFIGDWFNLSEVADGVFIFSAFTSPLQFFCLLFKYSGSKPQVKFALTAGSLHLYVPVPKET